MLKKKRRVYIKDWLDMKPYGRHTETDLYYLGLCNKVHDKLSGTPLLAFAALSKGEAIELSCLLVSYFEDIISGTNIWNAFLKKHQQLYGKKLPFYETAEYEENEINLQDVQFLVWYFINLKHEDVFLWPSNVFVLAIAERVMELFEQEYEYAPENEALKERYSLPKNADYYQAREIIYLLFTSTYLFLPDTGEKFLDMISETSKKEDENTMSYIRERTDRFALGIRSKLLALRANEWAALVLGEEHPLHDDILAISERANGWFYYNGQNETDIDLEHIVTGRKFKLAKKSYDDHDKLEKGVLVYLGMVLWKKEWWFSGISLISQDQDIVSKEKKSEIAMRELNFLEDKLEVKKIIAGQEQSFLDFNNGSHVAFLDKNQAKDFVQKAMDHYNHGLGLPKKELKEAEQRLGSIFDDEERGSIDFGDDFEDAVAFFNPNSGLEVYFDVASVFPLKGNPYYNKENKGQDFLEMMFSDFHSKEMLEFCLKNFKEDLEFFQRKEQYNENEFDFLLRFFKNEIYNTKPQITLTH